MMKEQKRIPISRVSRAGKIVGTGIKVGGNYVKYLAKRSADPKTAKDELNEKNATEILNALNELKGGALKIAQMLSMDYGILPKEYSEKFQSAQHNTTPLSYPLVVKTFKKSIGKHPNLLFDSFSKKAFSAASIGQVHKATLGDQTFAVKVQYPGVADSINSDLKMVRQLVSRAVKVSREELNYYLIEIEKKLLEETNYELELERSILLTESCQHFDQIIFPTYYPEYSSSKILTMDWVDGIHIKEWISTNPSQEMRNQTGQAIWDFFNFQVFQLKVAHADPHPGNFLITKDNQLAIVDFGCVKEIPDEFYNHLILFLESEVIENDQRLLIIYKDLDLFHPEDTEDQKRMYTDLYNTAVRHLSKPYHSDTFDFGDEGFMNQFYSIIEGVLLDKKIWKSNLARGNRDGIYINRIFFGLFSILYELKAKVQTRNVLSEARPGY